MERMSIISKLKERDIVHFSRDEQHEFAKVAFEMSYKSIEPVCDGTVDVMYRNSSIDPHNPLLWSFGHILFFWERFFCRFVYPHETYPLLDRVDDLYDSFLIGETRYTTRFDPKNHTINELTQYSDKIWIYVEKWILHSKKQSSYENYAFMTCLLHAHMHIECYLFDYQMFNMKNPFIQETKLKIPSNHNPLSLEMVLINGGEYLQGSPNDGKSMVWDNELSRFKTFIRSFWISKYPITQKQFLEFVTCGGYTDHKNWSVQGNAWRKKTHSVCPIYWKHEKGVWYRRHFAEWILLEYDYPMIHANYYEAEAYCKWANGRLLMESEWEYVATEGGKNTEFDKDLCNLDYSHGDIRSLREEAINGWGVSEMMGNVWCWCKDPFYPYPNYNIEPLYREFSYPFFGYKYILRGGCWAVPNILISKFYRNAQPADMRKQFTGFRLVREYKDRE